MRLLFFAFTALITTACNNNTTTAEERTDSTAEQKADTNEPGVPAEHPSVEIPEADVVASRCYWKILNRDTFAIRLDQSGNSVTGKLSFDNFEKDASSGIVRGKVEGNIIKLWYNFASEGMNSVMEVYFKKEGDQLLRGIGPVDVKGDSSYFTDPAAIEYRQDQSFNKIPCATLPGKYK